MIRGIQRMKETSGRVVLLKAGNSMIELQEIESPDNPLALDVNRI